MLSQLKPILNFAALGTGLGLLYGTAKTASQSFGLKGTLDPKPQAFHMDRQATHLFLQLQKYQAIADRPYRFALLYTDKLLYLEAMLASGLPANATDIQTASGFLAQVRMSCAELIDALPINVQARAESIVDELWVMLDLHMTTICGLCMGNDVMEPESKLDRDLNAMLSRYT